MKTIFKYILQKSLGFRNYLFTFSLFKIYTIRWDKKENDFFYFLKMIPENALILDIGANIGIMSVLLAKKARGSEILSFEPVPENAATLQRVIRFFKLNNVRVFEMALGNSEGEVEMVLPVMGAVKMQGLSHVIHESIKENNQGDKYKVSLRVLDKMNELKYISKPLKAIKIDVENFEYFVLEGTKQLLQKYKPIVYAELWKNENRDKCFELMKSIGYSINVVMNNVLVEYDEATHLSQNFIFYISGKD